LELESLTALAAAANMDHHQKQIEQIIEQQLQFQLQEQQRRQQQQQQQQQQQTATSYFYSDIDFKKECDSIKSDSSSDRRSLLKASATALSPAQVTTANKLLFGKTTAKAAETEGTEGTTLDIGTQKMNELLFEPKARFSEPVHSLHLEDNSKNEAYRLLHCEFIELQIEMQSVRTDRDSLLMSLKEAKDELHVAMEYIRSTNADANANGDSPTNSKKTQQQSQGVRSIHETEDALRSAEERISELHKLLTLRDEEIEDLSTRFAAERVSMFLFWTANTTIAY